VTALVRAPTPRSRGDQQVLLFGEVRPRGQVPATAPPKLAPPFGEAARTQAWREASDRRAAAVHFLAAQVARLTERPNPSPAATRGRPRRAAPGPTIDVAGLLGALERARQAERIAWAEHAPDLLGGAFPSRLRDGRVQQRPVGLMLDQDTGDLRSVTCSSLARETLVGNVQRQPGGSYEAQIRLRVLGHNLSAVLERSRCLAELGG